MKTAIVTLALAFSTLLVAPTIRNDPDSAPPSLWQRVTAMFGYAAR